ncbi:MAG: GUN4 N-terminal ARM-like repeat domain-containing protein [Halothece sp.]
MDNTNSPSPDQLTERQEKLFSESLKKQLPIISELASFGEAGLEVLRQFLEQEGASPTPAVGEAYIELYQANLPQFNQFLEDKFPQGVVPLKSERNIDYSPLQEALVKREFQEADRLTLLKRCELAGEQAMQRKWIYFTEVENFPSTDLKTMDQLWYVHSQGKFGFSVQRKLWLSLGKDFPKLWEKIAWKKGNLWTRYPNEFIWDLSAPVGHLPLSNQLRGVREFASLLSHPAWQE